MADGRSKIFPLIAITLVAVLLAAFLFLEFSKNDSDSTPEPDVADNDPEKDPVKDDGSKADPREKERLALAETVREKLEEGDLQGAREALTKLRALDPPEDLIAGLEQGVQDAEKAERRKKELAGKHAWEEKKEELDQMRDDFLWRKLLKELEALEKGHPSLVKVDVFRRFRNEVLQEAEEAEQAFIDNFRKATDADAKGQFQEAEDRLRIAKGLFPERAPEVDAFLRRIHEGQKKRLYENMVFVPSPPGGGWVIGEEGDTRNPRRTFKRGDFYIDRYEVTNEEYGVFLQGNPDHPKPHSPAWISGKMDLRFVKYPISGVTLEDAKAYAKWVGKRLPTAEEWEAAARGPLSKKYPWGNTFPEVKPYPCNSEEQVRVTNVLYAQPVGSFPDGRSAYGVHDMAGNVWEWTASTMKDKKNGGSETFQVCKGGSFMTSAKLCLSSGVYLEDPDLAHHDIGFRCVRDPEKK